MNEGLPLSDADTENIIQRILHLKNRYDSEAKNCQFLVFMDFDGTIIDGDVSEGKLSTPLRPGYDGLAKMAVQRGLSQRYHGEQAFLEMWQKYLFLLETDEPQSVVFLAEEFADLAEDKNRQISLMAKNHFQTILQGHIFCSSQKIIETLCRHNISLQIISAGVEIFMKEASSILPIPPYCISGVNRDQRIVSQDSIVNFADGKRLRMQSILESVRQAGKTPVVLAGFGNSWKSDVSFLNEVSNLLGLAYMINGKNSLHHKPKSPTKIVDISHHKILSDR